MEKGCGEVAIRRSVVRCTTASTGKGDCGTGIRTPIPRTRTECLAVRRSRKESPLRIEPSSATRFDAASRGRMLAMEQRLSLVTLGVANLSRARAFYEALGWSGTSPDDDVMFFQA